MSKINAINVLYLVVMMTMLLKVMLKIKKNIYIYGQPGFLMQNRHMI